MRKFALLFLLVPFIGCSTSPTEGDKKVNDQNIGAGEWLEKNAPDPLLQHVGCDIKQNSKLLEKNLGLAPKDRTPYSSASSEAYRNQSEKEHEKMPWLSWLTILGTAVGGWFARGGLGRLLMTAFPTFAAGPIGTVATTLIESIAALRKKAAAGAISEADVKAVVAKVQQTNGVQTLVDKLREGVERRLAVKKK